jgi:hypothetical protein
MTWKHITPQVIVKGFKKCCVSMQWMILMICCGMVVKRMALLEVREEVAGTDCEDGDGDTSW